MSTVPGEGHLRGYHVHIYYYDATEADAKNLHDQLVLVLADSRAGRSSPASRGRIRFRRCR